jgi:hypothetical protein
MKLRKAIMYMLGFYLSEGQNPATRRLADGAALFFGLRVSGS